MSKWSEDIELIQELDKLRQANLDFMSKCYFCGGMSMGIKSIEGKLYSICKDHTDMAIIS